MAVTQADIDALEAKINSGVAETSYKSGVVERKLANHDLSELRKRLAEMKAELAASQGKKLYRHLNVRKGF